MEDLKYVSGPFHSTRSLTEEHRDTDGYRRLPGMPNSISSNSLCDQHNSMDETNYTLERSFWEPNNSSNFSCNHCRRVLKRVAYSKEGQIIHISFLFIMMLLALALTFLSVHVKISPQGHNVLKKRNSTVVFFEGILDIFFALEVSVRILADGKSFWCGNGCSEKLAWSCCDIFVSLACLVTFFLYEVSPKKSILGQDEGTLTEIYVARNFACLLRVLCVLHWCTDTTTTAQDYDNNTQMLHEQQTATTTTTNRHSFFSKVFTRVRSLARSCMKSKRGQIFHIVFLTVMCVLAITLTVLSMSRDIHSYIVPPHSVTLITAEGIVDTSFAIEVIIRMFIQGKSFWTCSLTPSSVWNYCDFFIALFCLATFTIYVIMIEKHKDIEILYLGTGFMSTIYIVRVVLRLLRLVAFFHAWQRSRLELADLGGFDENLNASSSQTSLFNYWKEGDHINEAIENVLITTK